MTDFIEEAKKLGFSDAAAMDTGDLVFVSEYRKYCEENRCGCYNANPACPPQSGTVEEMHNKVQKYEKALVLQTIHENETDYKQAKLWQNRLTEQLAEKLKKEGKKDLMIISAGPYKHNSCMSAYCIDAQKMADTVGMICWNDDDRVRFFTLILYHEEQKEKNMEFMELLKTRRTYRRFTQEEVSDEVIKDILTAARYASSAANKQPLSYVVVKDPQKVKQVFDLTKWAGYFPNDEGRPKRGEEPVLFIGIIENQDINKNCDTDAGLAIGNMTLAAWHHGVGSCIIGACNKHKLSELFGLQEEQVLHTVVAFGYPSHESHIVDVRDGEIKYYLDEKRDYVVPKRKLEDVVKYL